MPEWAVAVSCQSGVPEWAVAVSCQSGVPEWAVAVSVKRSARMGRSGILSKRSARMGRSGILEEERKKINFALCYRYTKMGKIFPLAPCHRPALCQPVHLWGFAPYAPYGRSSRKPLSGSRQTVAGGSYSFIKRKLLHSAIAPFRNFFKSFTQPFLCRNNPIAFIPTPPGVLPVGAKKRVLILTHPFFCITR